jgi:hypothetical protein
VGHAATWQLLPLTQDHPLARQMSQLPVSIWGGTQGTRQLVVAARTTLLSRLQERSEVIQADVFSYGRGGHGSTRRRGGLGHHTARVFLALHEHRTGPLRATDLALLTGYEARCVIRKLLRMQELMVTARASMVQHHECGTCHVTPGAPCRTSRGVTLPRGERHAARVQLARGRAGESYWRARARSCLIAAAEALKVHGTRARRARIYAAETELWHWWQEEVEWMASPKKDVRVGPRTHENQLTLILTTLGPKKWRRRYPRQQVELADGQRGVGRADHSVAWARVLRRMPVV